MHRCSTLVSASATSGAKPNELFWLNTGLPIDQLITSDSTPELTVANLFDYIDDGDYTNSFIHRSVPGFVIQGGGFFFDDFAKPAPEPSDYKRIATNPIVPNEPGISNIRSTIAMAKGGTPDSATNQWFINLADNSGEPNKLDTEVGGYTVFGQVIDNGMSVVDAIASQPVFTATVLNNAFTNLPLIDFANIGIFPDENDLVMVFGIERTTDISYSVINSRESLVAAAIIDPVLQLTPAAGETGLTVVTIRATSLDGLRISEDSFTVSVGALTSSISGKSWNDLNSDGVFDSEQPGLPNTTIYLDLNQNGSLDTGEPSALSAQDNVATTIVNETGDYTFPNLPADTYIVRDDLSFGSSVTSSGSYAFQSLAAGSYWISFDVMAVGRKGLQLSVAVNPAPVDLTNGQNKVVNFGLQSLPRAPDEQLTLTSGWNLISLPIQPINPDVEAVLSVPNTGSAGRRIVHRGRVWTWVNNGTRSKFESVSMIHALVGYYVYIPDQQTEVINIEGFQVVSSTVELFNGWNLIGPEKDSISTSSQPEISDSIWFWNNRNFHLADAMNKFKGYWLFANEDTFLNVDL